MRNILNALTNISVVLFAVTFAEGITKYLHYKGLALWAVFVAAGVLSSRIYTILEIKKPDL